MEFTEIKTQEEFDKAIKERIERAEKTTREKVEKELASKYSDYEEIKKMNTDYANKVSLYEQEKKTYEETIANDSKKIDELTTQSKAHETNSVKMRIALEKGLPYELATRLNGASVEEIEQDAESLLKMVAKPVAPISSNEPTAYLDDDKKGMKAIVAEMVHKNRQE